MRAAVALRVDEENPLAALEIKDGWPTPEPGPGQVRIRLAATTVRLGTMVLSLRRDEDVQNDAGGCR